MKNKPYLLTFFLLALPAVADPTDDWLKEAWQMNYDAVVKVDPAAKTVLWMKGALASGEDNPHQIHLDAKQHYTFFADCGRNCRRLGLTLIHNGRILRRDMPPHAFPMMGWRAVEDGSYTLQVYMGECIQQEECRYSLQVFQGGRSVF